jgi:hypothetical protein
LKDIKLFYHMFFVQFKVLIVQEQMNLGVEDCFLAKLYNH